MSTNNNVTLQAHYQGKKIVVKIKSKNNPNQIEDASIKIKNSLDKDVNQNKDENPRIKRAKVDFKRYRGAFPKDFFGAVEIDERYCATSYLMNPSTIPLQEPNFKEGYEQNIMTSEIIQPNEAKLSQYEDYPNNSFEKSLKNQRRQAYLYCENQIGKRPVSDQKRRCKSEADSPEKEPNCQLTERKVEIISSTNSSVQKQFNLMILQKESICNIQYASFQKEEEIFPLIQQSTPIRIIQNTFSRQQSQKSTPKFISQCNENTQKNQIILRKLNQSDKSFENNSLNNISNEHVKDLQNSKKGIMSEKDIYSQKKARPRQLLSQIESARQFTLVSLEKPEQFQNSQNDIQSQQKKVEEENQLFQLKKCPQRGLQQIQIRSKTFEKEPGDHLVPSKMFHMNDKENLMSHFDGSLKSSQKQLQNLIFRNQNKIHNTQQGVNPCFTESFERDFTPPNKNEITKHYQYPIQRMQTDPDPYQDDKSERKSLKCSSSKKSREFIRKEGIVNMLLSLNKTNLNDTITNQKVLNYPKQKIQKQVLSQVESAPFLNSEIPQRSRCFTSDQDQNRISMRVLPDRGILPSIEQDKEKSFKKKICIEGKEEQLLNQRKNQIPKRKCADIDKSRPCSQLIKKFQDLMQPHSNLEFSFGNSMQLISNNQQNEKSLEQQNFKISTLNNLDHKIVQEKELLHSKLQFHRSALSKVSLNKSFYYRKLSSSALKQTVNQ